MSYIVEPQPNTLDWHASLLKGWIPQSQQNAPYSYGHLTKDINDFQARFNTLIYRLSRGVYKDLLRPIEGIDEPLSFPEVLNPVDDPLVFIEPKIQHQTGLYPKAAYWQSGWDDAQPYVAIRSEVYNRLSRIAQKLRELDPELCLCITDGWRSIDQQQSLFDAFYPDGYKEGDAIYVSEPQILDRYAAPHPSGGAVDLFIGINGQAISLGTSYDYMERQSNTDYFETSGPSPARDMRRVLHNLCADEGLVSIDSEYWHFEYGTRRWAGKQQQVPIYGNADIDPVMYETIEPVEPVFGSVRAYSRGITLDPHVREL